MWPSRKARSSVRELGAYLERFFKQPEHLRLVAHVLHEESGVDEQRIYDELVRSDPFGISPFTFRTTVCCLLNNLLDTFKQTSLGSTLGMGGNTFKHLWHQDVRGVVSGPLKTGANIDEGDQGRIEIDEDYNILLLPRMPSLRTLTQMVRQSGRIPAHELDEMENNLFADRNSEYYGRLVLEVTPCDQVGQMRRFLGTLRQRADQARADRLAHRRAQDIEIFVSGKLTFDGTHLGFGAHLEIHPVIDAHF